MPFTTVVVEADLEQRSGFLEHPEGKSKIHFDHTGWRKKANGGLQNADAKTKKFPPQGSKVQVVEVADDTTDSPKAVTWLLIERGKKEKQADQ